MPKESQKIRQNETVSRSALGEIKIEKKEVKTKITVEASQILNRKVS